MRDCSSASLEAVAGSKGNISVRTNLQVLVSLLSLSFVCLSLKSTANVAKEKG